MIATSPTWGATTDAAGAYLAERANGATLLSIPGGHSLDALCHCLGEFRDVSERMFLIHKLEENSWNVTQTAQSIDTPRSNLYKKLEQYDIRREEAPREP